MRQLRLGGGQGAFYWPARKLQDALAIALGKGLHSEAARRGSSVSCGVSEREAQGLRRVGGERLVGLRWKRQGALKITQKDERSSGNQHALGLDKLSCDMLGGRFMRSTIVRIKIDNVNYAQSDILVITAPPELPAALWYVWAHHIPLREQRPAYSITVTPNRARIVVVNEPTHHRHNS